MRLSLRVAVGLSILSFSAGCATGAVGRAETGMAKALISDQQESQLGDQVHQQLEKQGTKYVTDPVVVSYVKGVADRVLASAKTDRPGVTWSIYVIDDPKTVNAFATPGGNLYVYTGLLLAAGNEAELAGVWGHEAGHVVAHHSARQMVDAYGLEAVLGLALGQNPGLIAQLGSSLAVKGTMLAHSRGDEDQADEYGARYASAAGYDPHQLIEFFRKLEALQGKSPRAMQWISDHPLTQNRIAHLQTFIQQNNLGGSDVGAARLAPIKQRLGNSQPLAPRTSG